MQGTYFLLFLGAFLFSVGCAHNPPPMKEASLVTETKDQGVSLNTEGSMDGRAVADQILPKHRVKTGRRIGPQAMGTKMPYGPAPLQALPLNVPAFKLENIADVTAPIPEEANAAVGNFFYSHWVWTLSFCMGTVAYLGFMSYWRRRSVK